MYNINDCNKCGSTAELICGDNDLYSIECARWNNCLNSTDRTYKDEYEAIAVWNKANPIEIVAEAV